MTQDVSRRAFLKAGTGVSALAAAPTGGFFEGLRARLRAFLAGDDAWTAGAASDDSMWPYVLEFDGSEVTVYQPQPERMDGTRLFGRSAISVKTPDAKAPIFGTAWFSTRIEVDQEERIYTVREVDFTDVKLPQADEETVTLAKAVLTEAFADFDGVFPLDPLLESLEAADVHADALKDLANDPPKIVHVEQESILVSIDGAPILGPVEGNKDGVMRVQNTAFTILQDPDSKKFYLKGDEWWYEADAATGPWTETEGVPDKVLDAVPGVPDDYKQEADEARAVAKEAPKEGEEKRPGIVVATEPTELIWSEGAVQWKPVPNTTLQYAANSSGNVVKTRDGKIYTPLSGRWYTGPSIEGPWSYVPPEQVPAEFRKIPKDAEVAGVLPFVAGTDEAKAALQEQQVPTTAEVKKGAKSEITWAGDPIFEKVPGLDLQTSRNASSPVVLTANAYYACNTGVWYQAPSPKGPYIVATAVPAEIYKLPASHPFHFVTYVRVFGEGPDVVYTGYYPGYKGSYSNGQTVVQGTGYTQPPVVVNNIYIPPPMPPTWGLGMHYNPWTGWSMGLTFGFGMGAGWFVFSMGGGPRPFPFWGPVGFSPWWRPPFYAGFRPPYWGRPIYRPPYIPAYRPGGNVNRPGGGGYRPPAGGGGYRPGGGWAPSNRPRPTPLPGAGGNLYNRPGNSNITRPATRPANRPTTTLPNVGGKPGRPETRPGTGRPETRPAGRPEAKPGTGRPTTLPSKDNRPTTRPGTGPNNVYSDRQGNVYRDTPNGWQQNKGGNQWQKPTDKGGTTRPAPGYSGPSTRPAPSDVGGYAQARDRASARPQGGYGGGMSGNYGGGRAPSGQQSRPAPRPAPSGGGRPAPSGGSRPAPSGGARPSTRPAPTGGRRR